MTVIRRTLRLLVQHYGGSYLVNILLGKGSIKRQRLNTSQCVYISISMQWTRAYQINLVSGQARYPVSGWIFGQITCISSSVIRTNWISGPALRPDIRSIHGNITCSFYNTLLALKKSKFSKPAPLCVYSL